MCRIFVLQLEHIHTLDLASIPSYVGNVTAWCSRLAHISTTCSAPGTVTFIGINSRLIKAGLLQDEDYLVQVMSQHLMELFNKLLSLFGLNTFLRFVPSSNNFFDPLSYSASFVFYILDTKYILRKMAATLCSLLFAVEKVNHHCILHTRNKLSGFTAIILVATSPEGAVFKVDTHLQSS